MAIIGRNYVERPRFTESVYPVGWYRVSGSGFDELQPSHVASRAGADYYTGGSGFRITGNATRGFIALRVSESGDELPPGARFKVFAWVNTSGSGSTRQVSLIPRVQGDFREIFIGPAGAERITDLGTYAEDEGTIAQLSAATEVRTPSSGYEVIEFEGVIPDVHGMTYTNGSQVYEVEPGETNQSAEWYLAFDAGGNQNLFAVAALRFDFDTGYADGLLPGYFDGDQDDDGAVSYEWAGLPFESISRAVDESVITELEAPAPIFTDNAATGGGSWTTETIEGIEYDPATGDAAPGETVTVTATALSGYVLIGTTEWAHTFPEVPDPEDPDPEDPDPEDPDPEDPDPEDPDPEDPDPEDPDPEDPDPEDPDPEDPDPEDPDPETGQYVETITKRVATSLGIDAEDNEAMAIATEGTQTVLMFAYAYCRGNGFTMTGAGDIVTDNPEITAAIVAGACRYVANPTGLEYRAGTETVSGAFSGWTLAEQAVLNNYRKRWA